MSQNEVAIRLFPSLCGAYIMGPKTGSYLLKVSRSHRPHYLTLQGPTYLCPRALGWGEQNSLFLRRLAGDLGRT